MVIEEKQNNQTLSDFVYKKIKEMILTRQIKCGEKIIENNISNILGTSRTPVREAIIRLSKEGIVKILPNRRSEVIRFDEKSIKDLGILRINLDIIAAQLAIHNGSNNDFLNLRKIAEQCKEAYEKKDLEKRVKYDCDFHLFLTEITKNQFLIDIQKRLYLKIQLLQLSVLEYDVEACNIDIHLEVVNKLLERSTTDVIKLLIKHLSSFYGINNNDFKILMLNQEAY